MTKAPKKETKKETKKEVKKEAKMFNGMPVYVKPSGAELLLNPTEANLAKAKELGWKPA